MCYCFVIGWCFCGFGLGVNFFCRFYVVLFFVELFGYVGFWWYYWVVLVCVLFGVICNVRGVGLRYVGFLGGVLD